MSGVCASSPWRAVSLLLLAGAWPVKLI
jgi:hypothetical protein